MASSPSPPSSSNNTFSRVGSARWRAQSCGSHPGGRTEDKSAQKSSPPFSLLLLPHDGGKKKSYPPSCSCKLDAVLKAVNNLLLAAQHARKAKKAPSRRPEEGEKKKNTPSGDCEARSVLRGGATLLSGL